jgi:hypothetical protein
MFQHPASKGTPSSRLAFEPHSRRGLRRAAPLVRPPRIPRVDSEAGTHGCRLRRRRASGGRRIRHRAARGVGLLGRATALSGSRGAPAGPRHQRCRPRFARAGTTRVESGLRDEDELEELEELLHRTVDEWRAQLSAAYADFADFAVATLRIALAPGAGAEGWREDDTATRSAWGFDVECIRVRCGSGMDGRTRACRSRTASGLRPGFPVSTPRSATTTTSVCSSAIQRTTSAGLLRRRRFGCGTAA